MVRSCVSCRTRTVAAKMFPLQSDSDHQLRLVDGHRHGRTAYICQNASCIETILAQPRRAGRSLKRNKIEADHLRGDLLHELEFSLEARILYLFRSGHVAYKPKQIRKTNELLCVIAAAESVPFLEGIDWYPTPWSPVELGNMIKKRPQAALGLISHPEVFSILKRLQLWNALR